MKLLIDAWKSLNNTGRIVLFVGVVIVLLTAMIFGLDLRWLPALLTGN